MLERKEEKKIDTFHIKNNSAYQLIASRGYPTVACAVTLSKGITAHAKVPSHASTDGREAGELRDGEKNKYNGKGVLKAMSNLNDSIAPELIGKDARRQSMIDEIKIASDGTENKAKLGANAILAVSLAVAKSAAKTSKKPLYR